MRKVGKGVDLGKMNEANGGENGEDDWMWGLLKREKKWLNSEGKGPMGKMQAKCAEEAHRVGAVQLSPQSSSSMG
jgi:hypothetical protein